MVRPDAAMWANAKGDVTHLVAVYVPGVWVRKADVVAVGAAVAHPHLVAGLQRQARQLDGGRDRPLERVYIGEHPQPFLHSG